MASGIYGVRVAARLWRRPPFQQAFSTSACVRFGGHFWRPKPKVQKPKKEDITAKIQLLVRKRSAFVDAASAYVSQQPLALGADENANYPGFDAFDSISEVLDLSDNAQLSVGSFAEFYDPITYKTNVGVVIAAASSRFLPGLNLARVLTLSGEVVEVDGPQVTFHVYRLWDDEELDTSNHSATINALQSFVNEVDKESGSMTLYLEKLYLRMSDPHTMKGILLEQIYKLLVQEVFTSLPETYQQQAAILVGIHLALCRSPSWIVSSLSLQNKMSNLVANQSSNLLASNSTYFVNSIRNVDSISKFIAEFAKRKTEFNNHLAFMITNDSVASSYENLMHYYNIWDGKEYRHLIETLKFALIYPHPQITNKLNKLEVFKSLGGANPLSIHQVLCQLKIYDNKANQLTDPLISANTLGDIQLSNLAASNLSELIHSENNQQMEDKVSITSDKFPHLRNDVSTNNENTIYAIPLANPVGEKTKQSYICVSLPKDSNVKGLDFYIPDIAAKMSPSTTKFENIWTGRVPACAIMNLPNNQETSMIEPEISSKLAYPGNVDINRTLVGDIALEAEIPRDLTSMTISFRSRSKFEPLFKDLGKKVTISLESLPPSNFQVLDWEMLQALLETGKSTKRREQMKQEFPNLTEEDEKQIKQIYEVLNNHFIHRVKNAAAPTLTMDYDANACDSSRISIQGRINDKQVIKTQIKESHVPLKSDMSESMIFVDEANKMLGHMISEYCFNNRIPIIRDTQFLYLTLMANTPGDEAVVSHDNKYFPTFEADSYYHTLIVKNPEWSLSASALLIGRHFLLKPTRSVSTTLKEEDDNEDSLTNLPLGMKHGYVSIADPIHDYSSWVNQLQLVHHLQKEYTESWTNVSRFNYLIKLGYSLEGVQSESHLQTAVDSITNSFLVAHYINCWSKRFWTLRKLEQDMLEKQTPPKYQCVVTQVGPTIESIELKPRLCLGFCKQLDLEVELVTNEEIKIGTQVSAKKIVHLNSIEGTCVLLL